jgi:hypothetical protein
VTQPTPPDPELLAALDRLEAESNARREELKALAIQIPATISRRALLRSVASDLRHSPNKAAILKRAVTKLARAPLHAAKRLQLRLRAR